MSASPIPDARRARVRIGVGAALILVLAGLGVAVVASLLTPRGDDVVIAPTRSAHASTPESDGSDAVVIYVHILGQVGRPGLYELHDGDRAIDAVAAAGGLTPTADQAAINLARFLSDGEQLIVPAVGEVPAPGAAAPPGAAGSSAGPVNLNSADEAALDTLPRIGPATAARIIAWRDANGPFSSVDDLLSVPGIGDKTLDGLRDLVTV